MKQFVCRECGSVDLFTKTKTNNTMLYCSDCGAYQQNLGKSDKALFEEYKKSMSVDSLGVSGYGIDTLKDAISQQTRLNQIENNAFNRGVLKGLKMALSILEVDK